jgi:hypothetical protein
MKVFDYRVRGLAPRPAGPHGDVAEPFGEQSMAFIRIPGLINALMVENIRQVRELERHEHVSTVLSGKGGLMHRLLASRVSRDMFQFERELPAIEGGDTNNLRAAAPDALRVTGSELYKMACYVAGNDRTDDLEVVVQSWVARRFDARYEPSASVRAAARLLGSWHRRNALSAFACVASGRLERAKALLSATVAPELAAAYSPTLLLPYIVMCLERMRKMARDPMVGDRLSPELVVAGCLAAPRFVYRTCVKPIEVSFLPHPIPADTLLILPARRLRATGDGSSAFGGDDSSRYPALRLIRRLLTEVWIASRDVHHPVARRLEDVDVVLPRQWANVSSTAQTTLIFELGRLAEGTRKEAPRSRPRRRRHRSTRLIERGTPIG